MDYNILVNSFIYCYEQLQKEYLKDFFNWEAKIERNIKYQSDSIPNLQIRHYAYTGGAQVIKECVLSFLIQNTENQSPTINCLRARMFSKLSTKKKSITKHNIQENKSVNSEKFLFEADQFCSPLNMFYKDKELLLYYKPNEASSYVNRAEELPLSFKELNNCLLIKWLFIKTLR